MNKISAADLPAGFGSSYKFSKQKPSRTLTEPGVIDSFKRKINPPKNAAEISGSEALTYEGSDCAFDAALGLSPMEQHALNIATSNPEYTEAAAFILGL